jgi:chromosomal replication initiation ATPase DnaA
VGKLVAAGFSLRNDATLKRLSKEIPLEGVVKTVAEHYEVSMENLLRRSRRNGRERKIAIYFSKIMSKEKNSSIGKYFGIGPQAITNVLTDMESRIKESDDLKKEIDALKCIM